MRTRVQRFWWFGLALGLLVGCGHSQSAQGPTPVRLQIQPTEETNRNAPVRVELLWVYNKDTAEVLAGLSAREWFAQKGTIQAFYGDAAFESYYWEPVPGQDYIFTDLTYPGNAEASFVFVSYYTPGAHRLEVNPACHMTLRLKRDDFSVSYQNNCSP